MGLVFKAIVAFVVVSIVGLVVPMYFPINQVIWWALFGPVVSLAFVAPFAIHQIRKNLREEEEAGRQERASRTRS